MCMMVVYLFRQSFISFTDKKDLYNGRVNISHDVQKNSQATEMLVSIAVVKEVDQV